MPLLLRGREKREREINGDKKRHGVPFHHFKIFSCLEYFHPVKIEYVPDRNSHHESECKNKNTPLYSCFTKIIIVFSRLLWRSLILVNMTNKKRLP